MFRVACAALCACLAFLAPRPPALAATTGAGGEDPVFVSGRPVAQRFLDHGVSVVSTPAAEACVLGETIPIARSRYFAAGSRERLPFDRVIRSRATSFQLVAAAGAEPALRVQLKYPVDPQAPARLSAAGLFSLDLAPRLEPAGDAFRLHGAEAAAAIAALAEGRRLILAATSLDTERRVEDFIRIGGRRAEAAAALAAFEDCRASLAAAASASAEAPAAAMPTPAGAIALDLALSPSAASLVTPEEARVCGMADVDGPLHRGRVVAATGFVLPSDAIYGRFGEGGALEALYAPGSFEARREASGAFRVSVSRAANANVPLEPSLVKGCVGYAFTELCVYPEAESGALRMAPCLGELADFAAGEFAPLDPFLPPDLLGASAPPASPGAPARSWGGSGFDAPLAAAFAGLGGGGSGHVGRSGGGERKPARPDRDPDGGGADTEPRDPTVVPLPATLLLTAPGLLVAAGLAAAARRRRAV